MTDETTTNESQVTATMFNPLSGEPMYLVPERATVPTDMEYVEWDQVNDRIMFTEHRTLVLLPDNRSALSRHYTSEQLENPPYPDDVLDEDYSFPVIDREESRWQWCDEHAAYERQSNPTDRYGNKHALNDALGPIRYA